MAWVLSRIHTLSSALVYIGLPLNAGPQDLYTCSLSPARPQRQIISAKQWWDDTIHVAFTKSILRYASRKTASSLFISGCCYSLEPLFYLACTYFWGKSSSKGKLVWYDIMGIFRLRFDPQRIAEFVFALLVGRGSSIIPLIASPFWHGKEYSHSTLTHGKHWDLRRIPSR